MKACPFQRLVKEADLADISTLNYCQFVDDSLDASRPSVQGMLLCVRKHRFYAPLWIWPLIFGLCDLMSSRFHRGGALCRQLNCQRVEPVLVASSAGAV